MPVHYSRIPNPEQPSAFSEMEAAFDEEEEEEDHDEDVQQRRPLVRHDEHEETLSCAPTQYDFERIDYDYPPPGSPPRPSALALPANAAYGNTNGLLSNAPIERPTLRPKTYRAWFSQILPWIKSNSSRLSGRVGGGADNDGVFANLMSKPTRPRSIEDQDGVHIVPENAQTEAPPSYAAAQADAVPSYWETTIHAPAGGDVAGELIVDSLPTGSLFSFLWSMLVSVAFSFLGFVLTYLLHTTHAAKFGSRAGLGITLIQYGWALRTKADNYDGGGDSFFSEDGEVANTMHQHQPTYSSALDTTAWSQAHGNNTIPSHPPDAAPQFGGPYVLGESAAAWLSFFLMTVGWFLFLSSVLGFWRVKRWERGILHAAPPVDQPVNEDDTEHHVPISFTFPGLFFRDTLRLNGSRSADEEEGTGERFVLQEIDRQRQMAETRLNDARLQRSLRSAGLL